MKPPSILPDDPPARMSVSDAETASRIQLLFQQSSYPRLTRDVRCTFHEGVATLRGRLPSYFLKQLAQATAARAPRVEVIANHIEVV